MIARACFERTAARLSLKHYHPDPDHTPDGHLEADESAGDVEDNPLWQRDNVVLMSVGIDIGSAGTQILFSRVHLCRQAVDLSTRYLVVGRETLFESPVSLTPYAGETLIDARRLGEIVDDAYHRARLHPDDIDTGVVILTGEALRRENSEPIARILSEKCGDLVCATAGHHMEATLAAHGSGAVQLSSSRRLRLLNIDIGGGTTKLSLIDQGRLLATAALHIGSRLIAVDGEGVIVRLEPAGLEHVRRAGFSWRKGDRVSDAALAKVAESMADDLVAALTSAESSRDIGGLYLTEPIGSFGELDAIICSGGVAEYIYRREECEFGDLGKALGDALRSRIDAGALPWDLLSDSQGIRSTALGCSEFSVQLSGNTCYISDPKALLPRRNFKVLRPSVELAEEIDSQAVAASIRHHLTTFGIDVSAPDLVLAFHWDGLPRYRRLRAFAHGIALALAERAAKGLALYVILDADIGMNLGTILHKELAMGSEVLVIDGLELWDFDFIDIGAVRMPSMTVPVTIKSLIFSDVTDGARPRQLVHRLSAEKPVRTPADAAIL
jgi:ethanolamine utilization protein EutA